MSLPAVSVQWSDEIEFVPSGGSWTDFDGVISVNISRGRTTELEEVRAGSCTVTLDGTDRAFDPFNGSSPTAGDLVPDTPIRVFVAGQQVFTGYLDDGPTFAHNSAGGDPVVTMQASDFFRVLAQAADVSSSYPEQTTAARCVDVLDDIGAGDLDYFFGTQLIDAAPDYTGSALAMLRAAERTEAGVLFVERGGIMQMTNRYSFPSGATVLASYGPDDGGTFDAIYEGRPDPINPTWIMADRFICTREGGEPQSSGAASGNFLAPRVRTIDGLLYRYDEEAEAHAQWLALAYSDPDPFPAAVTFRAPQDDWSELTTREIQNRVEIDWYPYAAGSTVTDEVLIDSIQWSITSSDVAVTFGFGGTHKSDLFLDEDWFQLDNSTLNGGDVLIH